ncbi:hypothetical protein AUEXF2481DRAFT_43899 [Aureobasidium subglaciale EXF-2481]|uniref:Histone chaperone domain-containing protein n=1 Tax=Aureobasidium subglaciale (strain EXF-2481) TaxID=1043005 RepID=A0A074Y1Z6_AURSE|nr:uncharacterized protein AUEXF2481DRAFT_43899 [Aureobasidium subglaciale EXF-2481]KEQ91730.1 hypothetical protein AUEXF2481DRAFT_43899 [Aureobasidium subglaciale EXF-2481]
MSDEIKNTAQAGAPIVSDPEHQQAPSSKGKGKAVEDMDMDDDSSSEEEEQAAPEEQEEGEEDNMEEIDESNILSGGRRTRGKTIDFAKAAEGLDDDEDEDEDDDFEDPEEMKQ